MAILQRFRKGAETETEVHYFFGYPELDRRLTINKLDRTYLVADQREDHAFLAVLRRILAREAAEKAWPAGGGVQS
jgi:hypothetical protein